MADRKISDLTALTAPASGDYVPIVDISEAAAASKNKRITIQSLFQGIPVNVGIGTSSPTSLIHGRGTSAADVTYRLEPISNLYKSTLYISSTASGDGGIQYDSSPNHLRMFSYGTLSFNVGTANISGAIGNERLRIDSSGRLLVGTSTSRANFYNSTNSARFQIEGSGGNDNYALSIVSNFAGNTNGAQVILAKSRGSNVGDNTLPVSGDTIGQINFQGADGTEFVPAASIAGEVDGTPGANDMPGRLVFSVTADGAASPTEALRISNDRSITVSDGGHIVLGSTTGTKIGTATTQKIGFFNATPVVQPTEITDELTSITHTAPGTPDYAVQDLVQNTGFGFVTKDEGNTVLSVILNLQTRVNELETRLATLGLIADAD